MCSVRQKHANEGFRYDTHLLCTSCSASLIWQMLEPGGHNALCMYMTGLHTLTTNDWFLLSWFGTLWEDIIIKIPSIICHSHFNRFHTHISFVWLNGDKSNLWLFWGSTAVHPLDTKSLVSIWHACWVRQKNTNVQPSSFCESKTLESKQMVRVQVHANWLHITRYTYIWHDFVWILPGVRIVIACQYHFQCIGCVAFAVITLVVEGQHAIS